MAWAICVAYPWDKAMREPEDWDKWHVWIPRLEPEIYFSYIDYQYITDDRLVH